MHRTPKTPAPVLARMLAALLAATALPVVPTAVAQDAPPQFVSYDDSPFGPGERQLSVAVRLDPGDTSANVGIWVVYGDREATVRAATLSGSQPRGRARVDSTSADGVVRATFIFPHDAFPEPNAQDVAARRIAPGAAAFYKVVKARGTSVIESPVVGFTMPDPLTIVNFGDSFASGEGAPYRTGAKWDDDLCHRSGNSGQARAVGTIIAESRATAIAFRNVACSGAQIAEGILLSQPKPSWILEDLKPELQTPVRPQITVVHDWMHRNGYGELNIAMVSGGGNDVDFARFVETYLIWPNVLNADDRAAANLRQRIAQDIPQLYASLRQALDATFTYDRILVSEYPDAMRGADGRYCDMLASPRSEFEALDNAFLQPLNNTIRTAVAGIPKWQMVATAQRARGHGLCNDDAPYFNKDVGTSLWVQGDPFGIVHPNRVGHASTYQPAYEAALRDALRDIRRKWAILAAKRSAREKAEAAAMAAALQALVGDRARLVPGAAAAAPRISVPGALLARPPVLGDDAPPRGDRAALDALLAKARGAAPHRAVPGDSISDNRTPDGQN